MGDCTITIHATGSHHNKGNPKDINRMAVKFVDELVSAGHHVKGASLTNGAHESLLPDSGEGHENRTLRLE